jgi:hypothetical protein
MDTTTSTAPATFTSTTRDAVAPKWIYSVECRFICTHCGVCGRALKDALSVEKGIGPDCRAMYGDITTGGTPDWEAVRGMIRRFGGGEFAPDVLASEDARIVASVLLHRFSRRFQTARWIPGAVYALGYHKLAERMAKRAKVKLEAGTPEPEVATAPVTPAEIRIETRTDRWEFRGREYSREVLAVTSPKDEGFIAAMKTLPGHRWDREARVWTVPADQRPALWHAIKGAFAGLPLVSAKGTSTIPAL